MNWLEFLSSIVASLAWPSVVVIALFLFKEPLMRAIPRLNRLKYKELVAEFDRDLDKIEQEAQKAGLEKTMATEPTDEKEENLLQLAQISPNAAIVESFRHVEKSAKGLIKAHGLEPDYKVAAPYRLIERILSETGALRAVEVKMFRDLRQLRNKVTHSEAFEASHSQAIEYIELASLLANKIEVATSQKKQS